MIENIIQVLGKEEVRMFKLLVSRVDTAHDRKTLELFDLIRKEKREGRSIDTKTLTVELYGEDSPKNRNRLYVLKNRLQRELSRSLNFHHHEFDNEQRCIQQFLLARTLRKKGHQKLARRLYEKTLKEAEKHDLFLVQEMVFQELVTLSARDTTLDLDGLLEKRGENETKLNFLQESQNAMAIVNHQLAKSNFARKGEDIMSVMQQVRDRLQNYESIFNSPKGRIRIFNLTSQMLLQANNFEQLEVYLKDEYQEFQRLQFFDRNTHRTKLIMLIWLINTTFKNYKFEESIDYCGELKAGLEEYNRRYYPSFIPNYYLGLVNNYTCLGQSDRALILLKSVVQKEQKLTESEMGVYIFLNLANVHYEQNHLDKALETLAKSIRLPAFQNLSPLNQLLLHLFELALLYEQGDYEYQLTRIEQIKKKFSGELDQREEQRTFMQALEYLSTSGLEGMPNWEEESVKAFMQKPKEFLPGENEIIDYRLWLRAQKEGRRYPKMLLEVINGQRAALRGTSSHR